VRNYKKTLILKGTVFLFLITTIIFTLNVNTYAGEIIAISINNKIIQNELITIAQDGKVFMPISAIAEELGAEIAYNEKTKIVTINRQNKTIILSDLRNINGHIMLGIREVAEKLECEIRWSKEKRTIYIYTKDIIPNIKKGTDNWGRTIKLSSYPTGAGYFPYICEDIPNWIYEGIVEYMKNTNKRSLWSGYEYDKYGNPTTKWSINERNTPNDFVNSGYDSEVYYTRLKKYLDFCLNIDYRTLKRSDLKKVMIECMGENQFKNFDKMVDSWYRYYISNKIIISGESIIIPEGFHLTDDNLPVLTAYIKFNILSQSPKNYYIIGDKEDNCVFQTNKTYEGLFICPTISDQGDANNYKLDYDFLGLDIRDFRQEE
jgi:hypothetical protein